jgi:secondary thiamine-phosphate synthase enzyme
MFETIGVKTSSRVEMIDITDRIIDYISKNKIKNGLCCLSVPHTTAGITINENADPSVQLDINSKLNELIIADDIKYSHLEGNSDSHIKSTVVGQSLNIIIEKGNAVLGTWQGIFFCEFDGPRNRNLHIKIIEG